MPTDPSKRDPHVPGPPPLPPLTGRASAADDRRHAWPPIAGLPGGPVPASSPVSKPRPAPAPTPPKTVPVSSRAAEAPLPESPNETLPQSWLDTVPAWLVSFVFHLLLLVSLALITLPIHSPEILRLELGYSSPGAQLETMQLESFNSLGTDTEIAFGPTPVDDPLAAPPDVPVDIAGLTLASEMEVPTVGLALSGRQEGSKEGLLAAYGGTGGTEAAVARGLEWLKRNQQKDGTWRLDQPYADGGMGENRAAATAMALLAFQGAGHTHQQGSHKAVVQKGIKALLKMQDADGNFFQEGIAHHRLYSQAQATIVICELYGMTQDPELREPAERALRYCVLVQAPEGGWRYEPKVDSDTSVTGWFVMALQSGRMAGLTVPSTTLENVTRYLDSAALDDGSSYAYRPGEGPRISMTAEALLCRQYLGWKQNDPRLLRGIDQLLAKPISFERPDFYYWYYATQVLHHQGGPAWFQWNNVMRAALPAQQTTSGRESGSWDPSGDPHDEQGGRLYTTCLCIYMLEVYYRHLPIYKHL